MRSSSMSAGPPVASQEPDIVQQPRIRSRPLLKRPAPQRRDPPGPVETAPAPRGRRIRDGALTSTTVTPPSAPASSRVRHMTADPGRHPGRSAGTAAPRPGHRRVEVSQHDPGQLQPALINNQPRPVARPVPARIMLPALIPAELADRQPRDHIIDRHRRSKVVSATGRLPRRYLTRTRPARDSPAPRATRDDVTARTPQPVATPGHSHRNVRKRQ